MTVSAVSSTTSATANTTSTSNATTSNAALTLDFSQYLSILTTQLQNQDPTNATDPNQYTQELVQIEGVQQQINTENDLQNLAAAESASSLASGVGYIGNVVESSSSNGAFELQNSYAQFGYTLPSAASAATITIQNASGTTVATLAGSTASGANVVSWNGEDASGTALPAGQYTFTVAATDSSGNTLTSTSPVVFSQVTGVSSNSDGTLNLLAGGTTSSSGASSGTSGSSMTVSSSNVTAIYTTSTVPTATAATVIG